MGGKKRKYECVDLDAEKLLYSNFQHAANSIATLYSGSVTAQRRASARASRATLERILHFLIKDYGAVENVPKAALLHMLQQEYENVEGSEHLPHSFPVHLFPQPPSGPAQSEDAPAAAHAAVQGPGGSGGLDSASHAHQKRQHHHYTGHGSMLSPLGSRRGGGFVYSGGGPGGGAGAMEVSSDHELPNNASSGLMQPQAQPGGGFGSFLQGFGGGQPQHHPH